MIYIPTVGKMNVILYSFLFTDFCPHMCMCEGYAVVHLVEALHYNPEGCGFGPLWLHCGPGVDSVSNRNEYQGSLLGIKVVFV